MSIIDYKRRTKSPFIWDGDVMRPQVRAFILGLIKQNFPGAIGAFVLGSITTLHWNNSADVDVNVVYPEKTKTRPWQTIAISMAKEKIYIPETPHIVNFYVNKPKDAKDAIDRTVGAYNLGNGVWLKRPDDLYVDPATQEDKFKKQIEDIDINVAELNRDVKDIQLIIETFRHAPDDEKQLMLDHLLDKKKEIEEDLKALTEEYDELHKARLAAFEKEFAGDRNAANKHLLNQTLPGNVVFKMMERYGYRELLEKLRDIQKGLPA